MELSQFTDYSLRVLIAAAVADPEELLSVRDIAAGYGISRNHLVKVVHRLGQLGYLRTVRGRGGGVALARPAESITVGDVVRQTESMALVECLEDQGRCRIDGACGLKGAIHAALAAFMRILDSYTIADLVLNRCEINNLLQEKPQHV